MKLFFATVMLTMLPPATGQDTSGELKHVMVPPLAGNKSTLVSALNVERGVDYPSVIHLKGSVEIRTPVCLPVGPQKSLVCEGNMIVRADAAEFHEDSGQIEAHGDITVTPFSR